MDELDRKIQRALREGAGRNDDREDALMEAVQMTYEQRRKRAAWLSWAGTGIGLVLMLVGIGTIFVGILGGQTVAAVVGAMFFLFGDGWTTFSKLLYATWNNRIQLERDIKELHYDVLELHRRLDAMNQPRS